MKSSDFMNFLEKSEFSRKLPSSLLWTVFKKSLLEIHKAYSGHVSTDFLFVKHDVTLQAGGLYPNI